MSQAPRLTAEQNLIQAAQLLYNTAPQEYIAFAKALGFIMDDVLLVPRFQSLLQLSDSWR